MVTFGDNRFEMWSAFANPCQPVRKYVQQKKVRDYVRDNDVSRRLGGLTTSQVGVEHTMDAPSCVRMCRNESHCIYMLA